MLGLCTPGDPAVRFVVVAGPHSDPDQVQDLLTTFATALVSKQTTLG